MRLVTLTCSNTEIVHALGRSSWLVGCDDHSDWPVDVVGGLPRVGPDLGIDVEKVAALKPDLVLASLTVPGHEKIVSKLQAAELPYVVTEPISIGDVYADVRLLGDRLDAAEQAQRVVAKMRSELERTPPAEKRGRQPRVLVEWWPRPVIVPGRDSWVTQLLECAGGRNPMSDRAVKSSPISDDEAKAFEPDAVVISWCGVKLEKYRPAEVYKRQAWAELPAVKNKRVYCISEAHLGRPSPRLVDGYKALRRIVEDWQSA